MNSQEVNSSSAMFNDSLMSADDALTFLLNSASVSNKTERYSFNN